MKIKYFIRGVGIGIIITTLILGISGTSKMSDETIISKAKRLGMDFVDRPETESSAAPVNSDKPVEESEDNNGNTENDGGNAEADTETTVTPEDNAAPALEQPVASDEAKETAGMQEAELSQTSDEQQPSEAAEKVAGNDNPELIASTDTPSDSANQDSSDKVILVINRGDWSRKVAENLEKLGLLKKPEEFDKYLVDKGYADRIRVGKFEIDPDASFDEIAKTITE